MKNFDFFPFDIQETTVNLDYILKIYGIIDNGVKCIVNIVKYKPYFDVLLNDDNRDHLIDIYSCKKFICKSEIVRKFLLIGYNEMKNEFLRLYFYNNRERKSTINELREQGYKTFSDDLSFHYRKVARENKFSLTSWNMILKYEKYKIKSDNNHEIHEFDVTIDNIKLSENQNHDIKYITTLTFDIETFSGRGVGDLPQAKYEQDEVFVICMTFHYNNDPQPLKIYCLSIQDSCVDEKDNWKFIKCKDQKDIILQFAKIISKLKPNIVIGFNDSQYDWPFIMEKAKMLEIYQKFIDMLIGQKNSNISFYEQKSQIKISAIEIFDIIYIKIPGTIFIDVRMALKKIYERSEQSSLKYFLELLGLESKIDLSPVKIWKYYSDAKDNIIFDGKSQSESIDIHKKNIQEIIEYCVNDAISCQRLMVKQDIINNYIETSNISFVSLNDSYMYANACKVSNLIGVYAHQNDILFSMISNNNERNSKYPGAYVYDPQCGFNNKSPVSCFDIQSLYPSIIIALNFSPEKIIYNKQLYDDLKEKENLYEIEFTFDNKEIKAWTVRHNNNESKKGLYPRILENLLGDRLEMKKKMKQLLKKIGESSDNIKQLKFEYDKINLKQMAIKIYMNSFYGVTGNSLSPFFLVELAGGVTTTGQKIIKSIAKFLVEENDSKIIYGDTDSVFITHPENIYYNIQQDDKYLYWTKMVNKSIERAKEIQIKINDFLVKFTNTNYIKINFEGVLFPSFFLTKKKYFGIQHNETINESSRQQYWSNYDLYVKGLAIVKRGQSIFFKEFGRELIYRILNINNEYDNVIQLVELFIEIKMKQAYNIDFDCFKQSATWKPLVENQSVHKFIRRMKKENKQIPIPGDKFYYIVKRGDKHKCKGDLMEYFHTFQDNKDTMKLNMLYYFQSVTSICANLIVNDLYDSSDNDRLKKSEKYINNYINRIYENLSNDIKKYIISIKNDNNSSKKRKLNNNNNNRSSCNKRIKQTSIDNYFKKI